MTEELGQERLGTVLADRYRLDAILGHGGAGVVFEATHVLTERKVAVKLVDTSAASEANVTRLMKEARAAVRLNHPNVVEVLDMGQLDEGAVFLVLELLRGKSLAQRLKGRKKLNLDATYEILEPIMEAVALAHNEGLIHRDLKPGNIFLHEEGHRVIPKLLDFGVVKETDPNAVRQTQVGVVLGTPHFMAPEQARGLPDIGPPVDVWAMGVVLYRSLSGFLPFRGKNVPLVLREITRGEFIPLWEHVPTLPGPVVRVIQDAMIVDRAQRYETMGAFLEALRSAKAGKVVRRPGSVAPSLLGSLDLGPPPPSAPIDPDEDETPLPTRESLEIPEYRAATTGSVKVGRSIPRAALALAGMVAVVGAAGTAWTMRERWVAPEIAPIADGSAREDKRIEVPDEAPTPDDIPVEVAAAAAAEEAKKAKEAEEAEAKARVAQAAKAIQDEVTARIEAAAAVAQKAEEAKAALTGPAAQARVLQAAATAAKTSALSARERYAVSRSALVEGERRAERALRSTRSISSRATEPADRRTAQRAREAAEQDVEAAHSAVVACTRATQAALGPDTLDARWRKAEAMENRGELAEAARNYDEIAQIATALVSHCSSRGVTPASRSDALVAVAPVEPPKPASEEAPVVKKDDSRARAKAHYSRALDLKQRGQSKQAIAELTEAIALEPKFVSAFNSRGLLRRAMGDVAKAIEDFDAAHQLDPQNAGVLNNRGHAKLAKNDLEGALSDFDAAIARDGTNPSFFENRGTARYLRGKFPEATLDFGRAIELAPTNMSAYRRRARTLQKLGDHAAAKADFDRVIAKSPNDLDARFARGRSRQELDDLDGAVADFSKVIELSPKRSDAYLSRGLIYMKQGKGPAAKSDFLRHLELTPNSRHKKIIERHLATLR